MMKDNPNHLPIATPNLHRKCLAKTELVACASRIGITCGVLCSPGKKGWDYHQSRHGKKWLKHSGEVRLPLGVVVVGHHRMLGGSQPM